MKTYKDRVARKWRFWVVSNFITLAILLTIGYAIVTLVIDIPVEKQPMFIYILGGCGLAIAFFLGQTVNNILVRSWDTWIGDLGPTQIRVLIEEMKKKADDE